MKFTSISMLTAVAILQVTSAFATEKPLHFVQHNFVANKAIYKPDVIEKDFVNGCARVLCSDKIIRWPY
ncbi:MAG: hypothetical protein AABY33_03515 [Pseudomonadota bacterium]